MNIIIINNPVWCGVSRSRTEKFKSEGKQKEGGRDQGRKEGRKRWKKEWRETIPSLWYLSVTCACVGYGTCKDRMPHHFLSSVPNPCAGCVCCCILTSGVSLLFYDMSLQRLSVMVGCICSDSTSYHVPFACCVLPLGFCLKTPRKVWPHDLKTHSLRL